MCSKPSTTIGFERRFNPTLQLTRVEEFVADSAGIGAPKPPNLARIVEINRGPFLGSPPLVAGARRSAGRNAASRRTAGAPTISRATDTGAVNVPVSGSSFSTKAGFVLDADEPRVRARGIVRRGPARDPRPPLRRPSPTSPGSSLGGGDERTEPVAVDELEALMRLGRRGDRRAGEGRARHGLHPGQPQRPLSAAAHVLPRPRDDRPVVTICESGSRATDRGEHPARARLRRTPRQRGRHDRLARPRLGHRRVPALRIRRP